MTTREEASERGPVLLAITDIIQSQDFTTNMAARILDEVIAPLLAEARREGAAEALRTWVDGVRDELGATHEAGIDLGESYLHGMGSALRQASDRADAIERGA